MHDRVEARKRVRGARPVRWLSAIGSMGLSTLAACVSPATAFVETQVDVRIVDSRGVPVPDARVDVVCPRTNVGEFVPYLGPSFDTGIRRQTRGDHDWRAITRTGRDGGTHFLIPTRWYQFIKWGFDPSRPDSHQPPIASFEIQARAPLASANPSSEARWAEAHCMFPGSPGFGAAPADWDDAHVEVVRDPSGFGHVVRVELTCALPGVQTPTPATNLR